MELPSLDLIWSLSWLILVVPAGLFPLWMVLDRLLGSKFAFLHTGPQALNHVLTMQAKAQDVALLYSVDLLASAACAIALLHKNPEQVAMATGAALMLSWLIAYLVPIPSLVALAAALMILSGIVAPAAVWSAPASAGIVGDISGPANFTPTSDSASRDSASPVPFVRQSSTSQPEQTQTVNHPTLHAGGRAIVRTNGNLNLRGVPNGPVIGSLAPGTQVDILGGPVSSGGYLWWEVHTAQLTGWSAQGIGTKSWLEPVP